MKSKAERQILVAEEKHGTRYFDATTKEALHKSALLLLTERFKAGYWYYKPAEPKPPKGIPGTEEIQAMPEGKLKQTAIGMLNGFRRDYRCYQRDAELYDAIQEAVKTKDGAKAWECLRDRSDGEYEGVSLKPLEG